MAYRSRIKDTQSAAVKFVEWKIRTFNIVLFTKSYSPEGHKCHNWLRECCAGKRDYYDRVFYEKRGDVAEMDTYLWKLSGEDNRESHHVFVRGDYLGGYKTLSRLMRSGKLQRIVDNLSNFPPGASNYLSIDKSWNLAHEADPSILPELVLKVALNDPFQGVHLKVIKCEPDKRRSKTIPRLILASEFNSPGLRDSDSCTSSVEAELSPDEEREDLDAPQGGASYHSMLKIKSKKVTIQRDSTNSMESPQQEPLKEEKTKKLKKDRSKSKLNAKSKTKAGRSFTPQSSGLVHFEK